MAQRVMIFFDGPSFTNKLLERFAGRFVRYDLLAKKLVGDREMVAFHYHTTALDPAVNVKTWEKQQRFLEGLRSSIPDCYAVAHRMQNIGGKFKEKEVDQSICSLMSANAAKDRFDTAILVTHDRDYVSTVKMVQKDFEKRVELACFRGAKNSELIQSCDFTHFLTEAWMESVWDRAKERRVQAPRPVSLPTPTR